MSLRSTIATALSCTLAVSANAQDRIAGDWTGTLAAGPARLRVVFHISDSGGVLHTLMDSPDQEVKDIKVPVTTLRNDSLILFLGAASYKGKWSGNEISGEWFQGQAFPLNLARGAAKQKPQTPMPPFPYKSQDLTFSNSDGTMTYGATLTAPSDNKKHPALLLITGSGPQNRDEEILGHKPFAVIADYLTRKGYVVLRVDDRGRGLTSSGDLANATTADFANDAGFALDFLKQRPEVDPARLGMLGHSEGGMIATMLAARRKDVAFFISFAGPGVSNLDLMVAQNEAILKRSDMPAPAQAAYLALYRQLVRACGTATDGRALPATLNEVVGRWRRQTEPSLVASATGITDSASQQQFASNFAAQAGIPWFRYFINYDPHTLAKDIRSKVLVLNGAKDIQVVARLNNDGWRQLLQKSRAASYEIKELPGLNHLFQECKTCGTEEYGDLEQTISPLALSAIAEWLAKEVK